MTLEAPPLETGRLDRTETHRMLREMARDLAQREFAPRAAAVDENGEFPWENFRRLAEQGLTGIPIPEEHGGAGADYTSYVIVIEEIARACPSTGLTLCAHTSLGTVPIFRWGSDLLRNRYVPPNARGEKIGAYGLTEPGAGSDSAATQTRARPAPGGFTISGSKMFVTNAGVADTFTITAITDPEKPKHERISAFVLEKGWKGLIVAKKEDKLGMRGSDTCLITLEDVFAPEENLLGVRGEGFKYFMQTLDSGRIAIAALALGTAEGAFERAVRYARERRQFGVPIGAHQAIQFMIADMATEIEAARHLIYHAAALRDAGQPYSREAAIAKLFASEMGMRVTRNAIQVLGGYGFMREYAVERYYRDAKLCEIGEGTSEIQRIVIARAVLGKLDLPPKP